MWAAAFIYDVAAVKKIDGVSPPRFNLVFQVSALFHHEWPRFNLVLNLPGFWSPPISFCRRNQHFHKPCLTPHLVFIIVNKCSCSCGEIWKELYLPCDLRILGSLAPAGKYIIPGSLAHPRSQGSYEPLICLPHGISPAMETPHRIWATAHGFFRFPMRKNAHVSRIWATETPLVVVPADQLHKVVLVASVDWGLHPPWN